MFISRHGRKWTKTISFVSPDFTWNMSLTLNTQLKSMTTPHKPFPIELQNRIDYYYCFEDYGFHLKNHWRLESWVRVYRFLQRIFNSLQQQKFRSMPGYWSVVFCHYITNIDCGQIFIVLIPFVISHQILLIVL